MSVERDWSEPPEGKGVWQLSFGGDPLSFNWVEPSWETPAEDEEEISVVLPRPIRHEILPLREVLRREILTYLKRDEDTGTPGPWMIITEYSPEQTKSLLEEASRWGIPMPEELINIVEMQTSPSDSDYRLDRLVRDLIQLLGFQDERVRMRNPRGYFNSRIHRLAEEMDLGDFEL